MIRALFLGLLVALNVSCTWAVQLRDTADETGTRWALIPTIYGGYNKLIKGYDGYKNIGNMGADIYFRPGRSSVLPSAWYHNLLYRVSFDYFPLQVPEGVYNITEDVFSVNASIVYQFHQLHRESPQPWVPFIGLGGGIYQDRITLDTPASGKVSGHQNNKGYMASIGVFSPLFGTRWPIRFIPEVRYHRVEVPGGLATNMTYQMAICIWPTERKK